MSKHSHGNNEPPSAEEAKQDRKPENSDSPPAGSENKVENPAPETPEAKTTNELPAWEEKYAELNDQFLRKAADFENFRKRMNREKQEITEFANQNLLLDLLPVIDDFERAIKSAETCPSLKSTKDFNSFYEGVVMIEKRLTTQLENKWGLKRFDSTGEPFDPNRHEALQVEKAVGIEEAVVKEDYVKGYLLKDRVIRFAKVKVLMPETNAPPAGEAEAQKQTNETKK
jgi:molecular chaperone GrpE